MDSRNDHEKSDEEQKDEIYTTAFFILPAEALITLRDELEPLANEMAVRAIIYRYGFRSGEACTHSMGLRVSENLPLSEILPSLWDEIGLGRLSLKKEKKKEFEVKLEESIEANVLGEMGQAACDFTRGYLAGTVSYLSGSKYHCKEEKCISKGDSHCTFLLSLKGEGGEK